MPMFAKKALTKAERFTGPECLTDPYFKNVSNNGGTLKVFDYLHDTWVEFEIGDWIATGVKGENYPIKHDVLQETYREVSQ